MLSLQFTSPEIYFCFHWEEGFILHVNHLLAATKLFVSYKQKHVHKVLVNGLVKLAQEISVVRWTDRPDMTIAANWDFKHQTKSYKICRHKILLKLELFTDMWWLLSSADNLLQNRLDPDQNKVFKKDIPDLDANLTYRWYSWRIVGKKSCFLKVSSMQKLSRVLGVKGYLTLLLLWYYKNRSWVQG